MDLQPGLTHVDLVMDLQPGLTHVDLVVMYPQPGLTPVALEDLLGVHTKSYKAIDAHSLSIIHGR